MYGTKHDNGNKPIYSDDDDDDNDVVKVKRSKVEFDDSSVEEKLENLITSLGNKAMHSLESNLEGLAAVLESDLTTYKTKILNVLLQCATEKMERITIFTTLIGLLNAKNHSIVGEFLEMLVKKVKTYLKNSQWDDTLHVVRFISDLVNCNVVNAASIMNLYNNFVEVTLEEHIPQTRSDYFVLLVLNSLTWAGRTLFMRKSQDLNKLMTSMSQYLCRRQTRYLPVIRVLDNEDQEDWISCLWSQVQSLQRQDWNEKCIIRPYQAFSSVLDEALPHTLPHISVPTHESDIVYPLPRLIFRLFDYTDVPEGAHTLPGSHSIERYLIEDHLSTLMDATYFERKDCAVALLNAKFRAKVPLSYMIAETLLGKLFELPDTDYLELFYSVTFVELCKEDHEVMPLVLAQATGMLFDRLDIMHPVCADRFARWFSYHLSQFKFQWCWDEWLDAVSEGPDSPRFTFLQETINYLIRFSYQQHIFDLLPKGYAPVLPLPAESIFKYQNETGEGEDLPGYQAAQRLIEGIRSRCTPTEAMDTLKDLENPLSDDQGGDTYNPLQIDVFFTTLFHLGSKSFSHSFAALAKFHVLCKALIPIDCMPAQVQLLKVMHQVWRNHEQMIVVLVDKMIKVQLIKCQAAIEWCLSDSMRPWVTNFYLWEIINSTVSKMCKHCSKLTEDLHEARDKHESYQNRMREGVEQMEVDDMPTQEELSRRSQRVEEVVLELRLLMSTLCQGCIQVLADDSSTHRVRHCVRARLSYTLSQHLVEFQRYQQHLRVQIFAKANVAIPVMDILHEIDALTA